MKKSGKLPHKEKWEVREVINRFWSGSRCNSIGLCRFAMITCVSIRSISLTPWIMRFCSHRTVHVFVSERSHDGWIGIETNLNGQLFYGHNRFICIIFEMIEFAPNFNKTPEHQILPVFPTSNDSTIPFCDWSAHISLFHLITLLNSIRHLRLKKSSS